MTRQSKKNYKSKDSYTRSERHKLCAWGGYVDPYLSPESKEHFKEWLAKGSNTPLDFIAECAELDVKISIHYELHDKTFVASMNALNWSTHKSYVMSAYARDMDTALGLLQYKHEVLLGGEWFREVGGEEGDDMFG